MSRLGSGVVVIVVVVVVVASAACKKSPDACEHYIAVINKCRASDSGSADTSGLGGDDMALKLCRAFDHSPDPEDAVHHKNHQCAVKHDDCAGFEACLDDVQAELGGVDAAKVQAGVKLVVELAADVTTAVKAATDCDAQTKAVEDGLTAHKTQVDQLRGILVDRKVGVVITTSDRTAAALTAITKAAQCSPPTETFSRVFHDLPPPPRPTAVTGPKADKDACAGAAGMWSEVLGRYMDNEAELKPKVHDALVGRCIDDGWSADAATCFRDASDIDRLSLCDAQLTQAQSDAVTAALNALAPPAPE